LSEVRQDEHLAGSEQDTVAVAARYAAGLEPGDLVLVSGEIGVGKSTFVRAALRELGVEGPIPSPTFTIGRSYDGRLPLNHLDLYRLEGSPTDEVPDLLGEYLDPRGITFVEWPRGSWKDLLVPEGRICPVEITLEPDGARRIQFWDPAGTDG
jgi:tRNA threonylcarbamoyladenosine biosynthesis protein TsaE